MDGPNDDNANSEGQAPIDNQEIQIQIIDQNQNDIKTGEEAIDGAQAKMAKMPGEQFDKNEAITGGNPSSEYEDGNSTDMGYESNDGANIGCMACSPCCNATKSKNINKDSNL